MNHLKIEQYLNKLEKELQVIPALKKSEIILETKEHIEIQIGKGDSIENVLSQLGRADQLGQKYLRDLGYIRKEKSSFGKYFLMAVLGVFLLLFVGAGAILWKFSPIMSIDEQTGRFQLLGGTIDFQVGTNGNFFVKSPDSIKFKSEVSMENLSNVNIELQNAFLTLESHQGSKLSYECSADEDYSQLVQVQAQSVLFNWADKGLSCKMSIPYGKKIVIKMQNGSVSLDSLKSDINLKMKSGTVKIKPGQAEYNYHLSVVSGLIDPFINSNSANAFKVKIEVENGKITKL